MQVVAITCKTNNKPWPFFNAIVDGVFLESTTLSKIECLITNVYPKSEFSYEFDRNMKWLRHMKVRNGIVEDSGVMQILDNDYVQQLAEVFERCRQSNVVKVYDILGDTLATMTREEYSVGKFPTL